MVSQKIGEKKIDRATRRSIRSDLPDPMQNARISRDDTDPTVTLLVELGKHTKFNALQTKIEAGLSSRTKDSLLKALAATVKVLRREAKKEPLAKDLMVLASAALAETIKSELSKTWEIARVQMTQVERDAVGPTIFGLIEALSRHESYYRSWYGVRELKPRIKEAKQDKTKQNLLSSLLALIVYSEKLEGRKPAKDE